MSVSRKVLFVFWILGCANVSFSQSKKYLDNIGKYREVSVFNDSRYAGMTWEQFYALEEVNELVDPVNYDFNLMNAAIFFAVNKYRISKGKQAFEFEPHLRDAAAIHSAAMVNKNFFSHDNNYDPALKKTENRIALCGFTGSYWAENVSKMYQDMRNPKSYKQIAEEMVRALSFSRGHNENMLNKNYTKLGCALLFDRKKTNSDVWYFRSTHNFGAP